MRVDSFRSSSRNCADKNRNLVPFQDSETIKRERIFISVLSFSSPRKSQSKNIEEVMERNALPQDILMEILSWLPAKSLISNFKFVCKDWRSLIQDPDFIKMHLNRVSIHGDGERSLMRKPKYGKALFQLHPRLNIDKPPFVFEDVPISVATKLDFDFDILPSNSRTSPGSRLSRMASLHNVDYDSSSSRLIGSWNGLLCLSNNDDEHIVLLNPSTRKYKVSPRKLIQCPNQVTFHNNAYVVYGFGCFHNSTTTMDEYKVVRIACFYPDDDDDDDDEDDDDDDDDDDDSSFPFQIDIYSMSSNSWRTVKDIPPRSYFGHQSSGVFLNGVVHWMGCNHEDPDYPYNWDTIVSFNIRDEVFGQIPMAPWVNVVLNSEDVVLMNWRGYLGMIYYSCIERMDVDLEIWVMKEYGIGESWTKEFVIRTSDSDPLGELPAGFSIDPSCIMTCFWTGDQILIVGKYSSGRREYGRWVLYDLNKKKINEDFLMVDIPHNDWQEQFDYIDTLVSLKSSLLPLSNNRKRKNQNR